MPNARARQRKKKKYRAAYQEWFNNSLILDGYWTNPPSTRTIQDWAVRPPFRKRGRRQSKKPTRAVFPYARTQTRQLFLDHHWPVCLIDLVDSYIENPERKFMAWAIPWVYNRIGPQAWASVGWVEFAFDRYFADGPSRYNDARLWLLTPSPFAPEPHRDFMSYHSRYQLSVMRSDLDLVNERRRRLKAQIQVNKAAFLDRCSRLIRFYELDVLNTALKV